MDPSTSKGCDSYRLASFPVFGLLFKRGIFFGLVDWFDIHTAETARWLLERICVHTTDKDKTYYVIEVHSRDANKIVVAHVLMDTKTTKPQKDSGWNDGPASGGVDILKLPCPQLE